VQQEIEMQLEMHRLSGCQSYPFADPSELSDFNCQTEFSMSVQFDVISTMSNYHWGRYPLILVLLNTNEKCFHSLV